MYYPVIVNKDPKTVPPLDGLIAEAKELSLELSRSHIQEAEVFEDAVTSGRFYRKFGVIFYEKATGKWRLQTVRDRTQEELTLAIWSAVEHRRMGSKPVLSTRRWWENSCGQRLVVTLCREIHLDSEEDEMFVSIPETVPESFISSVTQGAL